MLPTAPVSPGDPLGPVAPVWPCTKMNVNMKLHMLDHGHKPRIDFAWTSYLCEKIKNDMQMK